MRLNIGVFQYKMRDEPSLKKIQRLENHLKKNTTLDLIVCPELFLSGYGSHKKIKECAEVKDGEYAITISLLAKRYSTAILYGYPEIEKDSLFNAAQLFSSTGQSLINHRKQLLPPTAKESTIFNRGNNDSIINFKGIKIAVVICYELEFPELIRRTALEGVKLILAPTAQSSHWPAAARHISRSRAFENGIFVVYANFVGKLNDIDFMGESKIIGPDGLDIVNSGKLEEVIVGEIDTSKIQLVRKKLPYLNDSKLYI